MLNFQEQFLNSSPYYQETNWTRFKTAISDAANESIPKKMSILLSVIGKKSMEPFEIPWICPVLYFNHNHDS